MSAASKGHDTVRHHLADSRLWGVPDKLGLARHNGKALLSLLRAFHRLSNVQPGEAGTDGVQHHSVLFVTLGQ